jgi:hypothetical protein
MRWQLRLEHRNLAAAENDPERFFLNVVRCRVLYAHAWAAAPRLSLGWLRLLAPVLGDPRLGMTRDLPATISPAPGPIPATRQRAVLPGRRTRFGRLLDYGMIGPRLQQLYEWSAHELGAPGLLDCIHDGAPTYAWPLADRAVWHPPKSASIQLVHRVLPAKTPGTRNRQALAHPTPDRLMTGPAPLSARHPPVSQHLDAGRDRAVVRVARHMPMMLGRPGRGSTDSVPLSGLMAQRVRVRPAA